MEIKEQSGQSGFVRNPGKIALLLIGVIAYEVYRVSQVVNFQFVDTLAGLVATAICISLFFASRKLIIKELNLEKDTEKQISKWPVRTLFAFSLIFFIGACEPSDLSNLEQSLRIYVVASALWYVTFGFAMLWYTWFAKTQASRSR